MRRLGSIRWVSEGVARVELEAGRDPVTGKRRRMSRRVEGSEVDCEKAIARMLIEIGMIPSAKSMTLAEYLDDLYMPWVDGHVRKSTRHGYKSKFDLHVKPKLGSIAVAKLEPYVLDRWRDDLISKMSGRSALHVYRALSTALNRAVKWRLINTNPLLAVEPPKASMRDLDTLTVQEVQAYLEAFNGHKIEPLVVLSINAGLRVCEVCALEWGDIDLKEGTVSVSRGLHERKCSVWYEQPKSQRSRRTVSLAASAVARLKTLRGIGPLVADGSGPMKPTAIARAYKKHVAKCELRYVPMMDLRHTHATLLLEAGVDIVIVSRRLGHSSIAITDQHYLRPKRSADQAAASPLENLLGKSGEEVESGKIGNDAGV